MLIKNSFCGFKDFNADRSTLSSVFCPLIYSWILRQSPIKQQLVYWHLPLFDFPKQGVLPSAFWMEWISSVFFVLLPQFIPSAFAFCFISLIFISHPFVILTLKVAY
jgi:hypothetical protein